MKKLTFFDILIFLTFLTLSLLSFKLFTNVSGKPEVYITTGEKEWVYDLSVDTIQTFYGPVGETTVEISNNRVRIISSDCKNQIGVLAGWIEKPGEWLSCLPNDIFILLKGQQEITLEEETDEISF